MIFSSLLPKPAAAMSSLLLLASIVVAPLPSSHAATATWSPESVLATGLMDAIESAGYEVRTAVNSAGRSVVVWNQQSMSTGGIGNTVPQTFASVHSSLTGTWSAPRALSPVGGANAGATVDPGGKVSVFWTVDGISYASSSSDGGVIWSQQTIPGGTGFILVPFGPLVDVDANGNITAILVKPRASDPSVFDVEAMVKSAGGTWRAPILLTGTAGATFFQAPRLNVLRDGRALLQIGTTTFLRNSSGQWSAPQAIDLNGLGQPAALSADIDANGKGYFVIRSATLGVYLSTSTSASSWSAPVHLTTLDSLVDSVQIAASSSGRAVIYGNDSIASSVRVSATSNGGSTWGRLSSLGAGFATNLNGAGSENGLYALGWMSFGGNVGYNVAGGSGLGNAPWTVSKLTGPVTSAAVAIAGKSGSNSARAAAGWSRRSTGTFDITIGAPTATIGR